MALAVVIALAAGVWVLWPDGERPTSTTTSVPVAAPSSTTSTPPGSTTSTPDDHIVTTVEEAEEILRELWFGWFEGIYNQDMDRIREVVVRQQDVDEAADQFDSHGFISEPTPGDLSFANTEIVRSDAECLVVWTTMTTSGFSSGTSSVLNILRQIDGTWKSFSIWQYRNDLWESDCAVSL